MKAVIILRYLMSKGEFLRHGFLGNVTSSAQNRRPYSMPLLIHTENKPDFIQVYCLNAVYFFILLPEDCILSCFKEEKLFAIPCNQTRLCDYLPFLATRLCFCDCLAIGDTQLVSVTVVR